MKILFNPEKAKNLNKYYAYSAWASAYGIDLKQPMTSTEKVGKFYRTYFSYKIGSVGDTFYKVPVEVSSDVFDIVEMGELKLEDWL